MANNKDRGKHTGSKDVDTSEKKLAQVPQLSWGASRKIQLSLEKEVAALKKKKIPSTTPKPNSGTTTRT
jgi:hypothetical protein